MSASGSSRADRFLRACRREPVDRTPVWFMRQAGRYLPEYRSLRGDTDVLTLTRDPQAAAEVALQPVRRLGVDAAILFSDIMVPVAAVGIDVRIVRDQGPTLAEPFRSDVDVARLRPLEPEDDIPFTLETIRILRKELEVPLIGFAGAPFTIASYLIEGRPSRDHARTKALMHGEPRTWERLMEALSSLMLDYLRAQVEAGVQAVQLFDSWAGALDRDDYERVVLPWSRRIFEGLAGAGVPLIHFGTGTGELLDLMRSAGADVVGVDWRVPLDRAWERIGPDAAVQGNLDPAACLGPWEAVERKALDVLRRAGGRPGHVFNLGHGVLPQTPPEHLERLVALVHERTEAGGG
ncbi:MAG TPA: uroporphyrinogen decarboxylase [Actinomycetota bacterium]|nr:uroporphyrinogen decarboxylase [Actinomycetota bacterium]